MVSPSVIWGILHRIAMTTVAVDRIHEHPSQCRLSHIDLPVYMAVLCSVDHSTVELIAITRFRSRVLVAIVLGLIQHKPRKTSEQT